MKGSIVTLVIAAATAGSAPAEAKCGCGAWLLTDKVVEGKPYIVIEASCVVARAQPPKLTLVDAKGKPFPLAVLTTHDGYNNSSQLVVTPERALAPGGYFLEGFETKLGLNVVPAIANAAVPAWTGTAKVLGQTQAELGCGPAKTVEVQASLDASLAFVELVDNAKHRMSGYVPVTHGTLAIGHGMCSGAFPLERGHGYTATITLIAPARGTSSSSKTIAFKYAP